MPCTCGMDCESYNAQVHVVMLTLQLYTRMHARTHAHTHKHTHHTFTHACVHQKAYRYGQDVEEEAVLGARGPVGQVDGQPTLSNG